MQLYRWLGSFFLPRQESIWNCWPRMKTRARPAQASEHRTWDDNSKTPQKTFDNGITQ